MCVSFDYALEPANRPATHRKRVAMSMDGDEATETETLDWACAQAAEANSSATSAPYSLNPSIACEHSGWR